MAKFLLDKHKLQYHPDVLAKFLRGEVFAPISMEISPAGRCNQKCHFCYVSYLMKKEKSPALMEESLFMKAINNCADFGVKALNFCGTGEPLLNPKTPQAILHARKLGMDTSLTTNGVLAGADKMESCVGALTWLRVSTSAGSAARYAQLQGSTEEDFLRMKKNLADLVRIRKEQNFKTTLGVAYFLFDGCEDEMLPFVNELKDTGIDYVQIKPLGDFEKNNYTYKKGVYRRLDDLLHQAEQLTSENFYCQVKWDSFRRLEEIEASGFALPAKCWGLLFFSNIGSDGNVYACAGSWYEPEDCFGSLRENTLEEIWHSARFREVFERRSCTDKKICFTQCHNIPMNSFLMDLKNPPEHVNFI